MTSRLQDADTVGVVGAGVMGGGIAQVLLGAGFRVVLQDERPEALERARRDIAQRLSRNVEKGQLSAEAAAVMVDRFVTTGRLADMAPARVVIEAIVEDLAVKQTLFRALEEVVAEGAVLASNTSSLSIAAIGRDCRRKDRICGLHFFNPVPVMRLVEVIPGPFTAESAVALALHLVERMQKTAVVAKDGPGFLVNLGGRAYYTEALHIEQEGVASFEEIDRIMKAAAGFRMGPFELMDLTGIDVNYPVTTMIHQGYGYDPRLKTTALHGLMNQAGRFGRKTGSGFYDYGHDAPGTSAPLPELRAVPMVGFVPDDGPGFARLRERHGLRDAAAGDDAPILVAPLGEDATTVAHRLGCAPERVVAVDFTGLERNFLSVMSPPVSSETRDVVAAWLVACGFGVAVVGDSPGFVAQRIVAMVVNLGCEMAQNRNGTPDDIDAAVRLGLNYPFGPLEWGDRIGRSEVYDTLRNIQEITGSDRYRPSLWLRRRVLLDRPLRSPDRP